MKETNRIETGFKILDELLSGGFPIPSSILLIGPIGTGKSTIAQQFLWNALLKGYKAIYVSVDTPPNDIIENMLNYGWDVKNYIANGQLNFVDGFSPRVGLDTIARYIIENPFDPDEVMRTLMLAEHETFSSEGGVLLFSHLSTIMFTWNKNKIIKFMERMHAEARKFNSVYLFIYNEGVRNPFIESFIRQIPDVVIRVSLEWNETSAKQYLWIEKCLKTNYHKVRLLCMPTPRGVDLLFGDFRERGVNQ
ncbi:MAG: hypothetical protein J7L82_02975 [Staphylothermus sp.]|nr:hypothetical protein [Staphylothermus sp.]